MTARDIAEETGLSKSKLIAFKDAREIWASSGDLVRPNSDASAHCPTAPSRQLSGRGAFGPAQVPLRTRCGMRLMHLSASLDIGVGIGPMPPERFGAPVGIVALATAASGADPRLHSGRSVEVGGP